MRQFDVVRLNGEPDDRLFLCLQSDFLADLNARLLAPLETRARYPTLIARLHPLLAVGGEERVLLTHLMAAVDRRLHTETLGNLASERYRILNAVDALVTGF